MVAMITILRLGHRRIRDKRISTHIGLTARALGADKVIFSGEKDDDLLYSVKKITEDWGGPFEAEYEKNWKKVINIFPATKVHLTMYGLPIQEKITELREKTDLLLIVGSEKVPGEVYQLADYNIAVTNQPHSEVAALAIFLDQFFQTSELLKNFKNPRIKVIPNEKGKTVENTTVKKD